MSARMPALVLIVALVGLAVAAGPEPPAEKKKAKNLVRNGDFEAGEITPQGWQTIDGLSTFWVKDEDKKRGKVIKFDTDVLQSQGYDWWAKIAKGASPKDAPKKLPTTEPKYDTLAGLDGVWYWSDAILIEKGKAYWLTIDAKGPPGGMLAWLIGYPQKPDTSFGADNGAFQEALEQRITGKPPDRKRNFEPFIKKYVWKGQLSLAGTSPDEWRTFSRREKPFRPTVPFPNVRFVRVMIYAYWPPGVYYADNVKLVEVEDKEAGKPAK